MPVDATLLLFFPTQSKSDPQLSPEAQRLLEAVLAPSSQPSAAAIPSSPSAVLDFESGEVLGQLPFEYSSFLDLPPAAFGKKVNKPGHSCSHTHTEKLCGHAMTARTLWVGWFCHSRRPGNTVLQFPLVMIKQMVRGCDYPRGAPASGGGTREQVDVSR